MRLRLSIVGVVLLMVSWRPARAQDTAREELTVPGLERPVTVYCDPWGVSHIYAASEQDLFLAQGFVAARDRLFQLEMWRRRATGTLAEILGEKGVEHDIGARLLRYRGEIDEEMSHYHPRGGRIIRSFVQGVNAYVELTEKQPALLPMEFELLGTKPGRWSPEVVVSRHNGLFRNVTSEVEFARVAARIGLDSLSELVNLQPQPQRLELPPGLELNWFEPNLLRLYNASRAAIPFGPEEIVLPEWRAEPAQTARLVPERFVPGEQGSNNWVVSPQRSFTGFPLLANDPHRTQQVPSLRYFTHLVAPGWNVIGGGEPALPGVSIGHNGFGAWGLTIFAIDQEDLYVYETQPDLSHYRYLGGWEKIEETEETISVKGSEPRRVKLRFTRHGPVIFEDPVNRRVFALRAAWLERGTAPYLASLRFNQARSRAEFQAACGFSLAPSENMVWADREGNIVWQAAGITPLRDGWNGLLPVPGDGRFEWQGFLPVHQLPHLVNPPEGFFATANQENLPPDYPFPVGFLWTDPFRFARVQELLGSGRLFSIADMKAFQQDEISIPARWLVPLLRGLESRDSETSEAIQLLRSWDFNLAADSIQAAVYMLWERKLVDKVWDVVLSSEVQELLSRRSIQAALGWILSPGPQFGEDPTAVRDRLLLESLREALADLEGRFGPDRSAWRWGDPKLHHILLEHPLSPAITESRRSLLDVGPLARGGSANTLNMTGDGDRQTSGASFRAIIDLADFDRSIATNSPGQSGDPSSPHYRDLFEMWGRGQYFPLLYTREKIEATARKITLLVPPPEGR